MIEIKNLVKHYGDIKALNGISFTVKDNEILGFLGPNGAGKSTTMNIITGYLSSTSGIVKINGHDILTEPDLAKKDIGYLPEQPPLYLDMTATEYLKFICELTGVPKKDHKEHMEQIMNMVGINLVA
jgi:ABC-2 type transport system ATP-binding protein